MTCCTLNEEATVHYTGETVVYYLDLGEWSKGRTITAVTSITSDDSALTISSAAVLTSDTDDYDRDGNAVTIEANTGIRFTLAGGTAGSEDDEFTCTLKVTYTTAAGTEQAPVRIKVLTI